MIADPLGLRGVFADFVYNVFLIYLLSCLFAALFFYRLGLLDSCPFACVFLHHRCVCVCMWCGSLSAPDDSLARILASFCERNTKDGLPIPYVGCSRGFALLGDVPRGGEDLVLPQHHVMYQSKP